MEVPVYVFTGFLDSGKTTLLKDTLSSPDFETERTLIILCEEGDEEYDEQFLSANGAYVVTVESQEKLTDSLPVQCAKKFDPDQVMIEWNGTWPIEHAFRPGIPETLGVRRHLLDCRRYDGGDVHDEYACHVSGAALSVRTHYL